MSSELIALKKKLRHTWTTFFSRFGKLLPVQKQALTVILEKKNAIIVSPTASGKTEAVVAPLIERLFKENWQGLAIVYICPTRALANDIEYRLKEQLADLGLSLAVKTGDKPFFSPKNPPNLLVTTPESFDSLICRHVSALENIRSVILDEIHLIHGTYRGDQVRILLRRLRQISRRPFNVYLMSATVPDIEELATQYVSNYKIIVHSKKRIINYTLISSVQEIFNFSVAENLKKLLFFCNKRAFAEQLAIECGKIWGKDKVVVHHGSLSRRTRHDVEEFLKYASSAICIATTTLEIGIDIGDIDAIVLTEVPWSISSLIQRIGRAGRRRQESRVFAIFHSEEERNMLVHMLEAAKKGYLQHQDSKFDPSVLVQQIFSCLYATPNGLSSDYFFSLFSDLFHPDSLRDILQHLSDNGWIENRGNKWYASTKLMDLGETGKIHSNIPSSEVLKVVDSASGHLIGEIASPVDNIFVLAGSTWRIVDVSENGIIYVKAEKLGSSVPDFQMYMPHGQFYHLLPENLKQSFHYKNKNMCRNSKLL